MTRALADGNAKELRQGADHIDGLPAAAPLLHPDDGVQGVVEKVGIDLGLEGIELVQAFLFLLLNDLKEALHKQFSYDRSRTSCGK